MFSKTFLVFIAASLFMMGCRFPGSNLRFGEPNPPAGQVKADLSKFSCLKNIDKTVDNYLNGRSNPTEVKNFMGCVRDALTRFKKSIKDNASSNYSPESLRKFLNSEYFPDRKISAALADEIMTLKIVILGGDRRVITSIEFDRLILLVDVIERQALVNLPYIPIYRLLPTLDRSQVSRAEMENAQMYLSQTGMEWAENLRRNEKSYSVASLQSFLTEVRAFLNWDKLNTNSNSVQDIVSVVKAYKHIATGFNGDYFRPQDWSMMADSILSLYGLYLSYKVKLEDGPIMYGPGLDYLISTVHKAFSLVERLIDQQNSRLITFSATDNLFSTMARVGAIPLGIREKSLRDVYKHLITRAFRNPSRKERNYTVTGLSSWELSEMRAEFNLWAAGQSYLSDNAKRALRAMPGGNMNILSNMATDAIKSFDFTRFILNGVDAGDKRSHEIEQIVRNVRPLFRDGDERVFVTPLAETEKYGLRHGMHNLTRMNLMRALVRILIRGFATDDRIASMAGVTDKEMENFYQKIRPLGEDLKFMDPRKTEVGLRIFNEGNLFTFSGNGVNPDGDSQARLLTFYEIIESLSLMWSGGQLRDELYDSISAKCLSEGVSLGPVDVFGEPKLNRECFFKHLKDNRFSEFSNLPRFTKFVSVQSQVNLQDFEQNLQAIASIPCEDQKYFEQAELATLTTVLHYSEVIFSIYDKDRNGVLSAPEAMRAFPRFHGYLAQQAKIQKDDDFDVSTLKAIFAFLIKYQELPGMADGATVWWFKWRYFDDDPNEFRSLRSIPANLPPDLVAEEKSSVNNKEKNLPEMSLDRFGIVRVLRALAAASPTKMRNPSCRIH